MKKSNVYVLKVTGSDVEKIKRYCKFVARKKWANRKLQFVLRQVGWINSVPAYHCFVRVGGAMTPSAKQNEEYLMSAHGQECLKSAWALVQAGLGLTDENGKLYVEKRHNTYMVGNSRSTKELAYKACERFVVDNYRQYA